MTNEDMIEQILSTNQKVSREELLEKLEKEKRKTGGFISDETLLRVIGVEFGVVFSSIETAVPALLICDLISGLYDVTVTGRVVAVFSPRAFNGKRSGKFASMLVADESGLLRIVLWNHQTSLVESDKVVVGQVIRFSHGYTREDSSGKVELHVGAKCEIEINPSNIQASDYPSIDRFLKKINEIVYDGKNGKVNTAGIVKRLFSASTFERQDLSSGRVMRFSLADETGEIAVVSWNEKVEELEKTLRSGVGLRLVGARVKRTMDGGLELHVDGGTYVETVVPEEKFLRIADLKEGMNHINLHGEVVAKPVVREVKTAKDERVKLASFELKDETGRIWFSAWRAQTSAVSNLKLGDKIAIRNAYAKKGFGEHLEISTKEATSIIVIS
jgi:ssDNA-binding replication factor A large subunit